ncbi:hypothetical protein MF672_031555 [Actinomadura sp. ATCC 31491]|uniref:DUF4071 domain-containing protein n=1 Tax=Actinomadura luzonensis TaxID=2805427 RepID=A0ABT0G188_9ACTN|nr:tetratricopeptide repeat-containing protein [Actinomadura luzonensis]MCK2218294.1 hypothetical protein [Actinomadura luzonensis]
MDFDLLWRNVHQPLLEELGFKAVRADGDLGALVIVEMIQRLALADAVIADVSLDNSNVYYEVGVRHAAKRDGCVLIAASWADPLFDLRQMRRLAYPLTDGRCGAAAAEAAKASLRGQLGPLLRGSSPVYEAIPGYPDLDTAQLQPFSAIVRPLYDFEIEAAAIQLTRNDQERAKRTRALVEEYGAQPVVRQSVMLELLKLIQDNLDWTDVLDYIHSLPPEFQQYPPVMEREQLALAKTGKVADSAAALRQLIDRHGPTSERLGLLGGRYKQLMFEARKAAVRREYLSQAIDAYEQGMTMDLNDYYPSSNLPRLYRLRGGRNDMRQADEICKIARVAWQASERRNTGDPWVLPAKLGDAFDRGDVKLARQLVKDIEARGISQHALDTTIQDLKISLAVTRGWRTRSRLRRVLGRLSTPKRE